MSDLAAALRDKRMGLGYRLRALGMAWVLSPPDLQAKLRAAFLRGLARG